MSWRGGGVRAQRVGGAGNLHRQGGGGGRGLVRSREVEQFCSSSCGLCLLWETGSGPKKGNERTMEPDLQLYQQLQEGRQPGAILLGHELRPGEQYGIDQQP